ncbi:Neurotransmitter-gated ion-channel ligand binding domain protein [Cooperia oncophora]
MQVDDAVDEGKGAGYILSRRRGIEAGSIRVWASQYSDDLDDRYRDRQISNDKVETWKEFVAQFRLRQEWFDDRLRFMDHQGPLSPEYRNFEFIHVARDQQLWIPDTFFQNERNGWYHMLDQENRFLKIRSDGKLIYDRRLTLHLACSMHLSRYPMDSQNCEIAFASYAYTTDDIKYEWDVEAIRIHDGANGALPNFDIATFRNGTCHSKTNTGTSHQCLNFD